MSLRLREHGCARDGVTEARGHAVTLFECREKLPARCYRGTRESARTRKSDNAFEKRCTRASARTHTHRTDPSLERERDYVLRR